MTDQERHRKEVVIAVIDFIAERSNESVKNLEFPDEQEREAKEVDAKFILGSSSVVLEHTRTESFSGQIGSSKLWEKFFGPLEKELSGKLSPDGSFRLSVPDYAIERVKPKDYEVVRRSLRIWIEATAPELPIAESCMLKADEYRNEIPNGVPFDVRLWKWSVTNVPGLLLIRRELTIGLQKERMKRIHTALDSKLPKLFEAKSRHNANSSALIIESDDISLGNFHEISDALKNEILKFGTNLIPEVIYLIETDREIPSSWILWILRENSNWTPDTNVGPYILNT